MTLSQLLKATLDHFLKRPILFLLLQAPEMSGEIFAQILKMGGKEVSFTMILFFLPYFSIVSFFSTFLIFNAISSPGKKTGKLFSDLGARWKQLVPASLLTGVILVMGLFLMVVPFFYFMAIFLFVPHFIWIEPPQPISNYLALSKRFAKMHLKWCLLFVVLMFIFGFGVDALISEGAEMLALEGMDQVLFALKTLISLTTGALMSIFIGQFFLNRHSAISE